MSKGKDLTGIKFGKLTPTSLLEERKGGYRYWICKCECGNIKEVRSGHLLKGYTQSCGCNWHKKNKNHSNWQGYEEISLDFFNTIIRGAKSRNIEFDVTIEYLWELFIKQKRRCALSGLPLYFSTTRKNKNKKKTVSVDRIDSKKGYVKGNIQWVHKTINIMKNKLTDEEFISFCRSVSEKKCFDGQYSIFIGRWQPPHFGHMYLFNEALKNNKKVLIAIRNIAPDEKNPLDVFQVKSLWEKIYSENENVKITIIPDIESVNWGRGVGYQTIEHVPPTDICNISATQIRNLIKEGSNDWKLMVDDKIHEDIIQLLS